MLPFRGQSVGLGEPFMRSDIVNRDQLEKRKRPASESPPNGSTIGGMQQQSSPSQRGDPMSMSSILGPSSRNIEADKRRRLDGSMPPSSTYPTSIKMEGSVPAPSGASSNSGPKITATNVGDSPASNLARRKWSGPIAEEAAQQAAAWRAQEQQRWGSSRSPKVGLTPLAGPGGQTEQRRTPPIGNIPALKRGNSPSRVEGHKRQRSDGFQTMHGSPLTRNLPLRAPTPPPGKQSHSTDSSPAGFNQPLPPMSRPGLAKPYAQQQPGGGVNFYRPGSPPQQSSSSQMINQQQSKGLSANSTSAPGPSKPFSASSYPYGQPSYHAYDSQGRPVEIDVEEVRGGAFAGHGNVPPTSQELHTYRHGAYNEQRHRPPPGSHDRQPAPPPPVAATSKVPAAQTTQSTAPAPLPPQKQSHSGQVVPRSSGAHVKERELKRRSMTPNAPGPAKGLLAPRVEQRRTNEEIGRRPTVPMKDFNQGPKVDSEAVWETLEEVQRGKGYEEDEGVVTKEIDSKEIMDASLHMGAKSRHLGNFQYDPRKSPLLPGDLLQANIGATLEIRVSGVHLGLGPKAKREQNDQVGGSKWTLGWRAKEQTTGFKGVNPSQSATTEHASEEDEDAMAFWDQDALLNRKLWGTDVYTDDSDIIAMCLHAGWIQGPVLQDVPSWVPPGKPMLAWRQMTKMYVEQGIEKRQVKVSSASSNEDNNKDKSGINGNNIGHKAERLQQLSLTADLSVIVRIAPKLIAYKGSQRCGVKSRSWGNGHDGVSLVIESVTLQEPGYASGEKGLRNAKHRIDHLARLKTLATIAIDDTTADDRLMEKAQGGGLIDIRVASKMFKGDESGKPFWQIDVNNGKLVQ